MPLFRLLLCLLVVFAFAGCPQKDERAEFTMINGAEPDSLDPAKIRGQPEGRVAYALFEGLTRYNAEGISEPGVAEKWDITPDGKRYTFHLRANAKWSNGDPLTAHDFIWSWLRALRMPECEYKYQYYFIVGAEAYGEAEDGKVPPPETVQIRAVDDRTLTVQLKSPTPFFIDLCTFYTLMPVHQKTVEKWEKVDESWIRPDRLVCNGPFTLQQWRLSDRIRLARNEQYWDAANTKMKTIDMLPVGNPYTALNIYLTGGADLMLDKSMVPTSLVRDLKPRADFHANPIAATYFVRYNVTRKPFNDVRVRKAFSLVINKKTCTDLAGAGEVPTGCLVPPGLAGYKGPKGLERNVELARQLLAEAGYPNGQGFPVVEYLHTNRAEIDKTIAVELQQTLRRELNISVQLKMQEWAVYLDSQSSVNYDFSRSSWVGDYRDPNTFLDMFLGGGGNNNTGWVHPRYDELIKKAAQEPDQEKRFAIFHEAETILVTEEVPICPIYNNVVVMFYKGDKLGGLQGNLTDDHPIRTMFWKKP